MALHVDTGCADFTPTSLENVYAQQLAELAAASTRAFRRPRRIARTASCGATGRRQPQVELSARDQARHELLLLAARTGLRDRPGFFTGSGMPMRFAASDGTLIDVYQAATQMTDESSQSYPFTIDALLDGALGPNGYYGAFTANMHTDSATSPDSDAIIAAATARGVPVVSARQMLEWVDGRNASSFGSISWGGNTLNFTICAAAGSDGLRAMVPMDARSGAPHRDHARRHPDHVQHARRSRAWTTRSSPLRRASIRRCMRSTRRRRSSRTSSPRRSRWSRDDHVDDGRGIRLSGVLRDSPGSLTLSASNGASVTSHSVDLTGLAAGTTYFFRVRWTDAAGNTAVSPPAIGSASELRDAASGADRYDGDRLRGRTARRGSYIGQTGDGEVLLTPTVGSEFSGSACPSGWFATPWQSGGSATVGGGSSRSTVR